MANISKEPIRLSPAKQTGSISSQTEHAPPLAPSSPRAPLPGQQLIEAIVVRSEPFVDLQRGGGEQYLLELKTPTGALFIKYHTALEQGTILLLEPDDQQSLKTADLNQEPLRLKQLKLAAQQFSNETLPKAKHIEGLSTRILNQLQSTSFESIPPRIKAALIAVLVRHSQTSNLEGPALKQWIQQIQKPVIPITDSSSAKSENTAQASMIKESTIREHIREAINQHTFARAGEVLKQLRELSQPIQSNAQWQKFVAELSTRCNHIDPAGQTHAAVRPPSTTAPAEAEQGIQTTAATVLPARLQPLFERLQPYLQHFERLSPPTPGTTSPSMVSQQHEHGQNKLPDTIVRERFAELLGKIATADSAVKTDAAGHIPVAPPLDQTDEFNMPQLIERISRRAESLPLAQLLMNLEQSLSQELSQRPDSIANRLRTEAQRILSNNALYTPESLKKQAHSALRPGSQGNTQALEAVLGESRSALAKLQSQQLNNLQFQFEPEYHRAHFQQFEIPVNLPGVMTHAFAEVWHPLDEADDNTREAATRQQRKWHLRLHIEFKPLPPHCIELFFSLKNEHEIQQLGLVFWSEDPLSLNLFNRYQEVLQSSLQAKGIEVDRIESKRGLPVREQISLHQHSQSMVDFKV